jgi:hypothetical protein
MISQANQPQMLLSSVEDQSEEQMETVSGGGLDIGEEPDLASKLYRHERAQSTPQLLQGSTHTSWTGPWPKWTGIKLSASTPLDSPVKASPPPLIDKAKDASL